MFFKSPAPLPPLPYALFLPDSGMYVSQVDTDSRRFRLTCEPERACTLPDGEARAAALDLIRCVGLTVELRPMQSAMGIQRAAT